MAATSGAVPMTLDVAVKATQRVRSDRTAATCSGFERQRAPIGLGEAHGGARPLGRHHPRPDVAVVVEPGHDDLVTGAERSAHGRSETHRE